MDVQRAVWTIAADATETYFVSDAARIGLPCYLYALITRAAWDATPADQRRRSTRGPAGETEHGSAVLTAHAPDEAPALLTLDPATGATVLVPVVIVEERL